MTVIPGLSRPLEEVGKHVEGWDESSDRLRVEVSGSVRRGSVSELLAPQLPCAWTLPTPAR